MAQLTITAKDTGFFNRSPLETALAPNVFLRTGVNLDGRIINLDGVWVAAENLGYDGFGIRVTAVGEMPVDAVLGQKSEIAVERLDYYRIENGTEISIGYAELPDPIVIAATFDQIGVQDFGWRADFGVALQSHIQANGYVFDGGAGDDYFDAHTQIIPVAGRVVMNGGDGNDKLHGSLGNDLIHGGAGDDVLIDPAGVNTLFGNQGDDIIKIGNGSTGSEARGGIGDDRLVSGKGGDALFGDEGHDALLGGRGADMLNGGNGDDMLDGGTGEDTLTGGRGDDHLTGGEDADLFVFYGHQNGQDVITDFEDGLDMMMIKQVGTFDALSISQVDQDTHIVWDGGAVVLEHVNMEVITTDDFIFT